MADENDIDLVTPLHYTQEEVGDRLSSRELEELNSLVDDYEQFADNEDDPRYQRWMELNRKAQGG